MPATLVTSIPGTSSAGKMAGHTFSPTKAVYTYRFLSLPPLFRYTYFFPGGQKMSLAFHFFLSMVGIDIFVRMRHSLSASRRAGWTTMCADL